MKCKICESDSKIFGQAMILKKYKVQYFRCTQCGFIQTEEPYWLDEAYASAITKSDIGLIGRNITFADRTRNFIVSCLDPTHRFVDYGGGYGMFVRLMRDKGFDFYRYDPLCENLFADGFDASSDHKYSLLTAWEVFEHLVDPICEIEKMLTFSHTMLFSTILLPLQPRPLDTWWYYAPEHGQHVSFYTARTLKAISEKFNLNLLYSKGNTHLFTDQSINPLFVRLSFNKRLSLLRKVIEKPQPPSLLEKDYNKITESLIR